MGRLAWYKRAMGMNLDHLGEAMGRDPEQLADWLSGRHNPFRKNREKIDLFLKNHEAFLLAEKKSHHSPKYLIQFKQYAV